MMPPWRADYNRTFIQTFIQGMSYLAKYKDFSADSEPSKGPENLLVLFRDLTRSPVSLSFSDSAAGGWIFSEKPSAVIQLIQDGKDGSAVAELRRTASPDVERFFSLKGQSFPETGRARFKIADFDASQTWLLVRHQDRMLARIPLDGSVTEWSENGVHFYLDYFNKTGSLPEQERMAEGKRNVLRFIGKSYQFAISWLAIAGVAAYLFSFLQSCRRKKFSDGFIIATALFGAVVMRILILSLISTTSFPALNVLYLSPAYPLLLLFIAITLSYKPLSDSPS
jgi:hypothetical protein